MITQKEAWVFCLRASGKSYPEIAELVGCTSPQAVRIFGQAQKKATAAGLSYKCNQPKKSSLPGSGSLKIVDLVQKPQPNELKGFARLVALAQEAGLQKNPS